MTKRLKLMSVAVASVLAMSGCAVSDLADEMSDDKPIVNHGVVFQADKTTVWGKTTNGVDLEDEGIVLYRGDDRVRVGWVTTGQTVLDNDREFVGNCIPLESEADGWNGDSFTPDGNLQGSCYLDR